ncbi:MAG: hypothetical protein NT023_15970, partial [Armatimonadetes bacterium]|nr:hypothetical protein [Armatimonadota bacterium]
LSQEIADRLEAMKREALRSALNNALNTSDAQKSALNNVLSSLQDDQLDQLLDVSTTPLGVISANNNSALHDQMMFAIPMSDLPPQAQANLNNLMGNPAFAPSVSGQNTLIPPAENLKAFQQSSVGLIAYEGSIGLGIVDSQGGDITGGALETVHRGTLPQGEERREIDSAIANHRLTLLEGLTLKCRNKTLTVPAGFNSVYMENIAEYIADFAGLAVITDDYLFSRSSGYPNILTYRPNLTLAEGLEQTARSFAHEIRYEGGVLQFKTLAPGRELRMEPSAEVFQCLREIHDKPRAVQMEDALKIVRLTREQIFLLDTSIPKNLHLPGLFYRLHNHYSGLHLYALCTPKERQQAEKEGVKFSDLNPQARAFFRKVQGRGLPSKLPETFKGRSAGLYLKTTYDALAEHITGLQIYLLSNHRHPSVTKTNLEL